MGKVSLTLVAVEKQSLLYILCVCVCGRTFPACEAHAFYYIAICCLTDYRIFSNFLKNCRILGKMLVNFEYDLISLQMFSEIFRALILIRRDIINV